MVSAPDPAAHSPAAAPEAVSVLAAVIASRRVQAPSLAATSASELTAIEAARAEDTPIDPMSPRAARSAPRRRSTAGDMGINLHPWGSSGVTPTDAFGLAIVVPVAAQGQLEESTVRPGQALRGGARLPLGRAGSNTGSNR